MSDVLHLVGVFFSYAVLAIFAQNAVFTRSLVFFQLCNHDVFSYRQGSLCLQFLLLFLRTFFQQLL